MLWDCTRLSECEHLPVTLWVYTNPRAALVKQTLPSVLSLAFTMCNRGQNYHFHSQKLSTALLILFGGFRYNIKNLSCLSSGSVLNWTCRNFSSFQNSHSIDEPWCLARKIQNFATSLLVLQVNGLGKPVTNFPLWLFRVLLRETHIISSQYLTSGLWQRNIWMIWCT